MFFCDRVLCFKCRFVSFIVYCLGEYNDKKLQRQLLDINESLLQHVISVLRHFEAATKILSSDLEPTLHLVLPVKCQLQKNLQANEEDCVILSQLKRHLLVMLEEYFPVLQIHRMTTLLDPRFKDGSGTSMTRDQKKTAISDLKQCVDNEVIITDSVNINTPNDANPTEVGDMRVSAATGSTQLNDGSESEVPPPPKKFHLNFLKSVIDKSVRLNVNEVDCYMSSSDTCDDLLTYWRERTQKWPKLSSVARKYLAIPASSTSSERSFSIAGLTINDRRSQLSSDVVDDLLFLHGLPVSAALKR